MPRNGSGVYSLPQPPFVSGTVISSSAVNSDLSDIAAALTGSLATNGSSSMTGQLKTPDGSNLAPSYSFANETNTGFTRPGTGEIGIVIQGTQVGLVNSSGIQAPVFGAMPIGSILDYGGTAAPSLWLLCFGQAISRTTYALLFSAIGTNFGVGDGATTFNLPDYRDVAAIGKGNMGGVDRALLTTAFFGSDPTVLGNVGGNQSKTLLTSNLPPYTPTTASVVNGAITFPNCANTSNATGAAGGLTTGGFIALGANLTALLNPVQATTTVTLNAQGGTSTAFATVQPSLIVNKMIFAGV